MRARYMLDTDMCIYIAKRRPQRVEACFSEIAPEKVVISVITHGELAFGTIKSRHAKSDQASLAEMLLQTEVLDLDERAAVVYGRVRADVERKGMVIGTNDLWIGAHALSLGRILVTNNTRELSRIEGLTLENWT
jgi:tRNA(fMet)-specific endonuclease VapC